MVAAMVSAALVSGQGASAQRLRAPAGLVTEATGNHGERFHLLLYGDSTALMWAPAAVAMADEYGWNQSLLWGPQCPWFHGTAHWVRAGEENPFCPRMARRFEEVAVTGDYDVVVVSSYTIVETALVEGGLSHPPGSPAWLARAESEIRAWMMRAEALGLGVVILEPIAPLAEAPASCLVGRSATRCDAEPIQDPVVDQLTGIIRAIAADREHVLTVDMEPLLCPDSQCLYLYDGIPVRDDQVHISEQFARAVSDAFAHRLLCAAGSGLVFPPEAQARAACRDQGSAMQSGQGTP